MVTFFYVVAALATEHGYKGSASVVLGDRIAPQTTESGPGNSIIVNYLDRAATDPMTTQPSVGKSLRLVLDPVTMQFGEVVQPNKKDAFIVMFKNDGTFTATTDCNTVGGKYVSTKDTISLSDIFSTKMYCEGSQENEYASLLEKTTHYMFTSKGELVLLLKYDSGSVYFK